MNGETIEEKPQTEKTENTENPVNTDNSATTDKTVLEELESEFNAFKESKTVHEVENTAVTQENGQVKSNDFPDSELTFGEDFKVQIFLGLFFSLLDGIHMFLYRFISKVDIDKDKFCLDDEDKEGLTVYFKTKRILEIINKLPSEIVGIVHMEYLYFQKFQEIKAMQKKPERKMLHTPPGEKKKSPAKKRGKKKTTRKKAAVKKIAE